ncbi:MAG: hypothetical protein IPM54_35640 [Polyangiaceae bacterium]|nr:hypothetical protein [Polyangiaceae bacterium]
MIHERLRLDEHGSGFVLAQHAVQDGIEHLNVHEDWGSEEQCGAIETKRTALTQHECWYGTCHRFAGRSHERAYDE